MSSVGPWDRPLACQQATPLAIIGIGCLFPKAPDARAYWLNVKHGVDAIGPVPPTHWKPEDYFDPDPKTPDRTYAARGGFLDPIEFRPLDFGIAPNDLEAIDTSQLLGLVAAREALRDAGYGPDRAFDRNRVSVILGVTGTLELVIPLGARLGHPRWRQALKDAGIPDAKADEIIRDIGDSYVGWQENSFPGLLGNVVAGRIANRLDLGGTNCVVDAACASSLSAIHLASLELAAGRSDLVITGGIDAFNDIFMYMCFSKTPALSPTGDAKPFDAAGDGTILGEGLGLVVLKRLEDARRDGDRVYAVIKGLGTSSDGKGNAVYAPSVVGQVKCLREAYRQANVAPDTIELVEAHGTGTRVGDAVEVEALTEVYRDARPEGSWCALGSVKSQIGHTKAAAGAAGLIKAALALHFKTLPPTIKVRQPIAALKDSPFYVNAERRPWVANPNHPRRAAVSAFGFGGSNFHCVLEEAEPAKRDIDWDGEVEIVALSAASIEELLPQLDDWSKPHSEPDAKQGLQQSEPDAKRGRTGGTQQSEPTAPRGTTANSPSLRVGLGSADWAEIQHAASASRERFGLDDPVRLLLVLERDATDLPKLISAVRAKLRAEPASSFWKLAEGAYFGQGKPAGKLAVLFPGQGSQYPNMLRDLACSFPAMQDVLANANRAFGNGSSRLSDRIYPPAAFSNEERERQKQNLRPTEIAQPAIGAVSLGAWRVLESFGVKPDAFAGHSYGELPALHAAGYFDEAAFHSISRERGRLMGSFHDGDAGAMLAVHAPLSTVESLLKEEKLDLVIANRNTPNQSVLSGRTSEIDRAASSLNQRMIQCTRLPVAAAFHSALVASARAPFCEALAGVPIQNAQRPVYANTTAAGYPNEPEAIRDLLAGQLAAPVNFVDEIRRMAHDGIRTFLEVGPGSTLTRLTSAILSEEGRAVEGWDVQALDASSGKKPGTLDLAHALAWLAARGHAIHLRFWQHSDRPTAATTPERKGLVVPICGANYVAPKKKPTRPTRPPVSPTPSASSLTSSQLPTPIAPLTSSKPTVKLAKAMIDPHVNPNGQHLPQTHATAEKQPAPSAEALSQALQVTQQSLSAFQKLQEQTAQLHKQFLENQEAAQRTLQMLLEQQQMLLQSGTGIHAAPAPRLATVARQPERVERNGHDRAPIAPREGLPRIAQPKSETNGVHHRNGHAQARDRSQEPAAPAREMAREPAAPATESANTLACAAGSQDRAAILFEVIAEKTGYPAEMLAPEMALDADLGIDSIKRVEIFSALQEKLPDAPVVKPEHLGSLHTLGDVITFLNRKPKAQAEDYVQKPEAQARAATSILDRASGFDSILFAVVAEKTGYPAEMLAPEMALDADLGIDSIKRVEIFSALQERLPEAPIVKPEHLGTLHTLADVVAFLKSNAGESEAIEPPALQKKTADSNEFAEPAVIIQRSVLRVVPAPVSRDAEALRSGALDQRAPLRNSFASRLHGNICVVGDDSPFCQSLRRAIADSGCNVSTLTWMDEPSSESSATIVGLLLVAPHSDDVPDLPLRALRWMKHLQPRLLAAAQDGASCFATITRLGGTFGIEGIAANVDAESGALTGLLKTASCEWPTVHCKAIDVAADFPAERSGEIWDAILQRGAVEIGFTRTHAVELKLEPQSTTAAGFDLSRSDVVVITGGARGVTAAAALAIAKRYQPTIALIGRTDIDRPEAESVRELVSESDIKRALSRLLQPAAPKAVETEYRRIVARREVLANLAAINATRAEAIYFAANVTDSDSIRKAVHAIRAQAGPITCLIHGAGVLADRRIEDLSDEAFASVYATKVDGLKNVLREIRADPLKALVLFSSSTGRFGRAGQAAYAAANEALNKIAQQQARLRPHCKVAAINWGPWDGGMVTPALRKMFADEGVGVIPLREGGEFLVRELAAPLSDVEVTAIARLTRDRKAVADQSRDRNEAERNGPRERLSQAFEREVSLRDHPVLCSHLIDGRVVLPMALHLEWLAHAAMHGNPGLVFHGVNDLRILRGVQFDADTSVPLRIWAGKPQKRESFFVVPVEMRGQRDGRESIHSRAEIVLAARLPAAPAPSEAIALPPAEFDVATAYERFLFHGPDLHGIEAIRGLDESGIVVDCRTSPAPSVWMKQPLRSAWLADPLVIDCAFQAMIVWSFARRGAGCLPCFAGTYRQYRRSFAREPVRIVLSIAEQSGAVARANIDFCDQSGAVIARIDNHESVIDERLARAFDRRRLVESVASF